MFHVKRLSSHTTAGLPLYVAAMVTRIHKGVRPRLFLKEHRKAKGLSAEAMGGRLGIERESVHRMERYPGRLSLEKQAAYAAALDIEPEDLRWPPGTPSLDGLIKNADPETQAMVADIVVRMVAGGKG